MHRCSRKAKQVRGLFDEGGRGIGGAQLAAGSIAVVKQSQLRSLRIVAAAAAVGFDNEQIGFAVVVQIGGVNILILAIPHQTVIEGNVRRDRLKRIAARDIAARPVPDAELEIGGGADGRQLDHCCAAAAVDVRRRAVQRPESIVRDVVADMNLPVGGHLRQIDMVAIGLVDRYQRLFGAVAIQIADDLELVGNIGSGRVRSKAEPLQRHGRNVGRRVQRIVVVGELRGRVAGGRTVVARTLGQRGQQQPAVVLRGDVTRRERTDCGSRYGGRDRGQCLRLHRQAAGQITGRHIVHAGYVRARLVIERDRAVALRCAEAGVRHRQGQHFAVAVVRIGIELVVADAIFDLLDQPAQCRRRAGRLHARIGGGCGAR